MPFIMILARVSPVVLFTIYMPKSEKGDNSVKYLKNFAKSKLYAIYHDPSLSGYPDIVVTRSCMG